MIKRVIILLISCIAFYSSFAQFPGTDSLRNFNNRWITNSAIQAFTNYRLNTLLNGMIDWIDSARAGVGGTIGVDSIGVLNDSTFRYRKNGVFQSIVIKGGAVQHDITLTGTGLSGSHLKVDTTILKTVADAQRVTDSLVALLALKLNISDTAAMMQPLYDYIASDTIHIYTAADPSPDTLYSYKNGDSTLVGYILKDASSTIHAGSYYNKNSWSDLTDFTNTGTDAAISSNKIVFTTGANNFSQYLSVDRNSMLERWSISALIVVDEKSATSYGVGIGMQSTNTFVNSNAIGRIDLSTGGTRGKVLLNLYNGTLSATSNDSLSFSVNDTLLLKVSMDQDVITVSAKNLTTNTTPVSVYYQYNMSSSPFIHNTGKFSVYPLGGAFTVDSLSVSSTETKYADVLIIGDSKSQGYNTTNVMKRFAERLHSKFTNVVLHAGSGDRITDAINSIQEIINLKPKQVLLAIGRNDIGEGIDSATIKTNYQTLTDSLINSGISVFHALPFYETSIDQEWFKNYIQRTFTNVIDTWTTTFNCNNCLSSDNVHLTDYGNEVAYNSIIESFQLNAGKNIDQWGLKRVLQYNDSANNKIILGPSKRNGSTQSAAFSQPLLHITNTSYPSINLHTASTSSSSGGGSLIWRGAVSGSKLQSSIFGDSAFFAIVAQQAAADSRNLAFFMSDTGATYYIPFNLRSTKADFLGQRQRPTAEAWYNLFAGVNLSGTSNFGATNAVFAVNANNNPIDIYNLPSVSLDTTTYKLLVRRSDGRTYSSFWQTFGGGTSGSAYGIDSTVIGGTTGSNLFVGSDGSLQQDNANFFYDSTNIRLGVGTNSIGSGIRIQATGGAILSTNGTTGGAIIQGNQATPYVALGTFADPISYLQIQSSGGANNINTKARNLRIFSTAASVGLTFNQATGEIFNGSASDFGAYLFQNTGGLYQNGDFSLNGIPTGAATDLLLVKGPDSLVKTVASSTFATQSALNDTAAAIRGDFPTGGITSINSQTQASQTISVGNGMSVSSGAGTHTISIQTSFITSGRYTPTLTGVTNVAGTTTHECTYFRVGNAVTVSGIIEIDPTSSATLTELRVQLPITSGVDFATIYECSGAGNAISTQGSSGGFTADTTNEEAFFSFVTATDANQSISFSFTYFITPL